MTITPEFFEDLDALSNDDKPTQEFAPGGAVLSIVSPIGGAGKTTVSILLATQIALSSQKSYDQGIVSEPLRVCVVDLDVRDGQIGLATEQSDATIDKIAAFDVSLDSGFLEDNLGHPKALGFHTLCAPHTRSRKITTGMYTDVLTELRSMFDIVVIDTGAGNDEFVSDVALPLSDMVLLVANATSQCIVRANRWAEEIRQSERGDDYLEKTFAFVNRYDEGAFSLEEMRHIGIPVLSSFPTNSEISKSLSGVEAVRSIITSNRTIGVASFKLATTVTSMLPGVSSTLSPIQ